MKTGFRASTPLITPKTPKKVQQSGRREKIEKFLSDQREKKMATKISIESQQLNCLKEDLALKRKFAEQEEAIEKELLAESKKMTSTMEHMASAMTNCFQMMQTMLQTQVQQQAFAYQNQHHPAGMSMQ